MMRWPSAGVRLAATAPAVEFGIKKICAIINAS